VTKRLFDVTLSGFGLLLSSPLWIVIAAAIRIQDRGPVFFTQPRVGENGQVFLAFKFRSMIVNADASAGPAQVRPADRRITPVGRVLRATAMDELPQLWNIFRGDMSFVGPRPLCPGEIEASGGGKMVRLDEIPGYEARHRIKPGLTGLTQVHAARDIPRIDKFRLDLEYAAQATFWLDMKLILLSFWITARGRWEHRGPKF
jgi:lipopolysaccharide/colanic/teichoic acid biosynthesis glycosyltransferase